jgi:hypothetical protein
MFRYPTLILACCLTLSPLWAQKVGELGVTGGVTYYIGDLNPSKHFPKNTKPAIGAVYRYNFSEHYAFRLQGIYSTLMAYDSDSPDPLQQQRNLHFRSRLFEASALLEVNFFRYRAKKDGRAWTPFLFAGLAYFRANPQAELNDEWIDLQPLGTEGQGTTARPFLEPYKVDLFAIPFGAGFKFNFGRLDFQLEWGMRRTYTDYIDDVSGTYVDNDLLSFENGPLAATMADRSGLGSLPGFSNADRARGNSNTRDWYNYTGISITFLLGGFTACDELYQNFGRR